MSLMAFHIVKRLAKLSINSSSKGVEFDTVCPIVFLATLNFKITPKAATSTSFRFSSSHNKTKSNDNVIFPKKVENVNKRSLVRRPRRERKHAYNRYQQYGDMSDEIFAHSVTAYGSKHTAVEAEMEKIKDLKRLTSFIRFKTLENRYFKKPEAPNILTWYCKEQIRFLHQQDPEEWSVEELTEKYPVSEMAIKKILMSRVRLHRVTDIKEHDMEVIGNWDKLYNSLSNYEDDEFVRIILADIGSEQNLCNVFPLRDEIGSEPSLAKPRRKKLGVFSSIVKDELKKKEIETNSLLSKHQEDLDKLRHTLTKIKEFLEDSELDYQNVCVKNDSGGQLKESKQPSQRHKSPFIQISTTSSDDDNTEIRHHVVDGCAYNEKGDFLYRVP